MAAIEELRATLRVGREVRPSKFYDHVVEGYVFRGSDVVEMGTWSSQKWSDERIREYERAVAVKEAVTTLYGAQTIAAWHRIADAWKRWDDERLDAKWDQGDPDSVPTPDDPPLGPWEEMLEQLTRTPADRSLFVTRCVFKDAGPQLLADIMHAGKAAI